MRDKQYIDLLIVQGKVEGTRTEGRIRAWSTFFLKLIMQIF